MSASHFVLAGILGWPVSHSRSPVIHNHWIAQHRLQGAYVQLAVQPAQLEAALRGLPALGFAILASSISVVWLLAFAVLLIGLAQGAEGDIGGYLISRHFNLKNYSLILGFVKAGLDGGGAIGALILSFTLRFSDSYAPFLLLAAVTSLAGAICFFLTGSGRSYGAKAQSVEAV